MRRDERWSFSNVGFQRTIRCYISYCLSLLSPSLALTSRFGLCSGCDNGLIYLYGTAAVITEIQLPCESIPFALLLRCCQGESLASHDQTVAMGNGNNGPTGSGLSAELNSRHGTSSLRRVPKKYATESRGHLILSNSSGFRIPESVNPHRERPASFILPTKGSPKVRRFRETFELPFPSSALAGGGEEVGQREPFSSIGRSVGCGE